VEKNVLVGLGVWKSTRSMKRKVVLLGDSGAGKSALLRNYLGADFSNQYVPTTDGEVVFHQETVHGQTVQLQFWDTAGGTSEEELKLLKIDCNQAHACLLVRSCAPSLLNASPCDDSLLLRCMI